MSVSRGEASGLWPTRAGISRGSNDDPGNRAKAAEFWLRPVIWTENADEHEMPVSDRAGRVRDVDNGPQG
jgi:hypothetical protein